jgi:hypothetical protein
MRTAEKLKIEGQMRLSVIDKKTGKRLQKQEYKDGITGDTGWEKNMVVETGKEFILDEIFNNGKWNAGFGILGAALGTSTNTIGGIVGPSFGAPVNVGDWFGVDEDDWKLFAEMARSALDSKSRTDQATTCVAIFLDAQLTFVGAPPTGICKIRECGIFLHAATAPTQNPQVDPTKKPYAMVARRVYYGTDDPVTPTQYVDRPFYKLNDGNPLLFEYKLTFG